ncbi:MAG: hypothetical protein AMXMBFR84_37950 [Candidatus Hydrogenedentota bacterium]
MIALDMWTGQWLAARAGVGLPLVLLGCILAVAGILLHRRHGGYPPLWLGLSFGMISTVLTVSLLGVTAWARAGEPGLVITVLGVGSPLAVAGRMVAAAIGQTMAESVYQVRFRNRFPREYGKAKRKIEAGDIEGAIHMYREYFEEDPRSAEPLLHAAALAEEQDMDREAETIYREVLDRFRKDKHIEAEVKSRLAARTR